VRTVFTGAEIPLLAGFCGTVFPYARASAVRAFYRRSYHIIPLPVFGLSILLYHGFYWSATYPAHDQKKRGKTQKKEKWGDFEQALRQKRK
jgi:hypothetical protein